MKRWGAESGQVGEHISRGGNRLCKGPVAEGNAMLFISSQEACVAGAQRPKGEKQG